MKIAKCISNDGYLMSLTVGETYTIVEDTVAQKHGRIRIIDNTGESYLYSIGMFEVNKVK